MGGSAMQSYGYESFSMTITIIEYNLIFKFFFLFQHQLRINSWIYLQGFRSLLKVFKENGRVAFSIG